MATQTIPVTGPDTNVETFRRIRKSIGVLGVGLPVMLVLLSLFPFFNTRVQPSISHYYHSNLRDLFTGVLCAVGLFLLRYKGHRNKQFWKNDSLLTNIAGLMAFGIALFPTDANTCAEKVNTLVDRCNGWLGWLHWAVEARTTCARPSVCRQTRNTPRWELALPQA